MQQLIDPLGAACVFGGTVLASVVRSGFGNSALAVRQIMALTRKKFDFARQRAELASNVEAIRHDGILRGYLGKVSDKEFRASTAALIRHRSTAALIEEHNRHRHAREAKREAAVTVFDQAAELAPVLGLAGTLLALTQIGNIGEEVAAGAETALMGSVSLAVISTLYGLLLAHGLLHPLAAAIERRGIYEEEQREALVSWLVQQLGPSCPKKISENDANAHNAGADNAGGNDVGADNVGPGTDNVGPGTIGKLNIAREAVS